METILKVRVNSRGRQLMAFVALCDYSGLNYRKGRRKLSHYRRRILKKSLNFPEVFHNGKLFASMSVIQSGTLFETTRQNIFYAKRQHPGPDREHLSHH